MISNPRENDAVRRALNLTFGQILQIIKFGAVGIGFNVWRGKASSFWTVTRNDNSCLISSRRRFPNVSKIYTNHDFAASVVNAINANTFNVFVRSIRGSFASNFRNQIRVSVHLISSN